RTGLGKSRMVSLPLGNRGMAPRAQNRLPGRTTGVQNRRKPQTRARLRSHRRLANPRLRETRPRPAAIARKRPLHPGRTRRHLGRAKKNGRPPPDLTLAQANRLVARLGGYAGRRGDEEPGAQSLGIGLRRLIDLTAGWTLRKQRQSTFNDERCV